MFDVTLMINTSPVEKIGKSLETGTTLSCALKDNTSILRPTIIIKSSAAIHTYNYMKILQFNRFYFIDDIKSLNNDMWEVSAHVDVLETYKTAILSNNAVIKRQQNNYNLYLDDPDFHCYNYEKLETKQFPANTFYKALRYVLVLNGS